MNSLGRRACCVCALGCGLVHAGGGGALSAQSSILMLLRNSAAQNRMVVDSAGGMVVTASDPASRLIWNPQFNAFRAGYTTSNFWDPPNLGLYSVAFGQYTQATGAASLAFGASSIASGQYGIAGGNASAATAYGSIAFGTQSAATALGAFAAGVLDTASAAGAVALGYNNKASGVHAVALGEFSIASGDASVALGSNASTAGMLGSFVFADLSTATPLLATSVNQFTVRASGGARVYTNPTLSAGATLAAGGSTWSAVSDRRRKEGFLPLDGEEMLARIRALPLSTWRYLAEEDHSTRHIGPMAQDWHRAFGFSRDSLTINSGDLDGVNLAGVQALEARSRAQAERIALLEAANRELIRERAAVQARLKRLESRAMK